MKAKRFRIDANIQRPKQLMENEQSQIRSIAKEVIKNKKYLYIDINEQNCFQTMNECDSQDEDEQIQKIGKNFKVNLNDLQSPNSKALSFLYRVKETHKKRRHALSMVKQELKRSTQNITNSIPKPLDSTKYVVGNGKTEKSNHMIKKEKPRERQKKFISLLSSSLIKELSPSNPQYRTIQTDRYSPEKRTQKYIERIRFMLPSITSGRKTMAF